jgi:hypothetical protein
MIETVAGSINTRLQVTAKNGTTGHMLQALVEDGGDARERKGSELNFLEHWERLSWRGRY